MPNNTPPPNGFPPNIEPNTFAFLGVLIGAILAQEMTINEQNSVGNWFELIGQYLLSTAAQAQLIQGRMQNQNNNNQNIKNNCGKNNNEKNPEIDYILAKMKRIEEELQKLKKNSNP